MSKACHCKNVPYRSGSMKPKIYTYLRRVTNHISTSFAQPPPYFQPNGWKKHLELCRLHSMLSCSWYTNMQYLATGWIHCKYFHSSSSLDSFKRCDFQCYLLSDNRWEYSVSEVLFAQWEQVLYQKSNFKIPSGFMQIYVVVFHTKLEMPHWGGLMLLLRFLH